MLGLNDNPTSNNSVVDSQQTQQLPSNSNNSSEIKPLGLNENIPQFNDPVSLTDKSLSQQISDTSTLESRLNTAYYFGTQKTAAQASDILNTSKKTGLSTAYVSDNMDSINDYLKQDKQDVPSIIQQNPMLADWLSKDPHHVALAQPDMSVLQYIGLQLAAIRNKYKEGQDSVELSNIGYDALLGKETPEQRQRQQQIEFDQNNQLDYGFGWLSKTPGSIAGQIPILGATIKTQIMSALALGAAGFATGAATGAGTALIAGQAGPQIAAPEEVVTVPSAALIGGTLGARTGAALGFELGTFAATSKMESGLAYLELEKLKDDNGKPIDRATMVGTSIIVGLVNGSLMAFGQKAIEKAIPGIGNMGRKESLDAIRNNPAFKQVISDYAKTVGEAAITGGVTMFADKLVSAAGQEFAKADLSKVDLSGLLQRVFTKENLAQATAAAEEGARGAGGLAGVAGLGNVAMKSKYIHDAQKNAENMVRVGESVQAMKMTQSNREQVKEVINHMTDNQNMYVDADKFVTYFQSRGEDPFKWAKDVFGKDDELKKAINNGTDFKIPAGDYYSDPKLGSGKNKAFMATITKTEPDGLNLMDIHKSIDQELQNLPESKPVDLVDQNNSQTQTQDLSTKPKVYKLNPINQEVKNSIKDQLSNIGFDAYTSDQYSTLYGSTFNSLADKVGVQPEELLKRYNISFNKETSPKSPIDRIKNIFTSPEPVTNSDLGKFNVNGKEFNITLAANSDRSTFLHETGHLYLEILKDLNQNYESFSIKNDFETIQNWLGVKSGEDISIAQHEQFARGFEAYLMEGKAPTKPLAKAFANFKVWLTRIYGSLKGLNVNISNDIRGVFDRLVAVDAEIQKVKDKYTLNPVLDQNYSKEYSNLVEKAQTKTLDTVTQKMFQNIKRENSAEYLAEKKSIKKDVLKSLNEDQGYNAAYALQKKELPNGTPIPDLGFPLKIDRKELESIIGKDKASSLPKEIFGKKSMPLEYMAESFGYDSVGKFAKDLYEIGHVGDFVDERVQKILDAKYPRLDSSPQELGNVIVKDLHNTERDKVLEYELKTIGKLQKDFKQAILDITERPIPTNALKEYAKREINNAVIDNIDPKMYLGAERKYAQQAGIYISKGMFKEAYDMKSKELLNNQLYQEAVAAQEVIKSSNERFKDFFKSDEDLAKARDIDLVNAGRALLSKYGFGPFDKSPFSYLKQTKEYAPDTYQTLLPLIEDAFNNGDNYLNVTFDQYKSMKEVVDALWNLSRSEKNVLIGDQKLDRQYVIDELSKSIESFKSKKQNNLLKSSDKIEELKVYLLGAKAAATRVEHWIDYLDNGDINGKWRSFIFNPVKDAATEFRLSKSDYFEKLLGILEPIKKTLATEKISAPELGDDYVFNSKAELFGAILHRGNYSNFQKLLRGYGWGELNEYGVLDTSRWDAFEKRMIDEGILTKLDYDTAQKIWDITQELKAPAQKSHKQMYGFYFNEVTSDKFTNKHGEYAGGYYPAVMDQMRAPIAMSFEEKDLIEKNNNSFMFPTTGRGNTKSRNNDFAAPLSLDPRLIMTHFDKMLRFIHIEPTIKEVSKIVINRDFKELLNDKFGPTIQKDMLVPWLQRSAQQKIALPSTSLGAFGRGVDRVASYLRKSTALQVLALNVTNALQQISSSSLAATRIHPTFIRDSLVDCIKNYSDVTKHIQKKSNFMKTVMGQSTYDIQSEINNIILNPSKYDQIKEFVHEHANFLDNTVAAFNRTLTWNASYNESIANGINEAAAIKKADADVRLTQSSYHAEDVSRIEVGSPSWRLFTMFYSYFNNQANLVGYEAKKILKNYGYKQGSGKLFYLYLTAYAIPAAFSGAVTQLLSGKMDKNDDGSYLDDWLGVFFNSQLDTGLSYFPIAGSVARRVKDELTDNRFKTDVISSPAIEMLNSSLAALGAPKDVIDNGELSKKNITDSLTLIGILSDLPIKPISKPINYLKDVQSGDANPTGPIDFTRGLITGKSGKY